jgi:putative ABC transport system permease protein
MEQYDKFKDMVKLPLATAPVTNSRQTIKYGDRSVESVFLNGSTADYLKTTNFTFDLGRFYSEIESKSSRYVVVIGSEISKNLFPRGDGLDKTIKIGGVDFKIIGVLTEQVFVPIGTIFQNFQGHSNGTITFNIRAASPAMIEDTKAEAEGVMRQIRGLQYNQENDFSINQQEGLMQNYNSVVGVIQIAGLFITGLSLFVGAIGIMNIMFVSVKERTKEIGLRKAIGAKKRTILGQFILESSTLCLMGGIIGMLLAILTSMLIKQYIATSISYSAVIIAITISLITGVAAGFAPAYTAAKMDPVDALRYE